MHPLLEICACTPRLENPGPIDSLSSITNDRYQKHPELMDQFGENVTRGILTMDGITPSSSFGHRSMPPVLASSFLSRSASERFVALSSNRQVVDVQISLDGEALARKVQAQSDQLSQLDPKLAEQYYAVIDLLNRTNPHAARHFLDFMDSVLDGQASLDGEPQPAAQFLPQNLQLDNEVAVRVSTFVAAVRGENISLSQSEVEVSLSVQRGVQQQKKVDPLILDIDGDGIETSGIERGILFDLEANGNLTSSSFVQGDDVLLALDRNENGAIDNGSELFGTQHGAENGFEELKKFDDNRDGVIDRQDSVFSRLLGLRRQSSGLETVSLAQLGVKGIFTAYQNQRKELHSGDDLLQLGSFLGDDGGLGVAADVGFSVRI